jgi:uncharacterized membrane protein
MSLSIDTSFNLDKSVGSNTAWSVKPMRIPALDFTKGALVLIMVLYHWMNYFIVIDGSVYKYLRFLTPSFIFITGFLISQTYLSKYETLGLQVPKRMAMRGLKLLLIAFCLNMTILGRISPFESRVSNRSISNFAAAFFAGTAPIAFSVLVPIAYLLILSACLLIISRYYKYVYHVVSLSVVASAMFCEWKGIQCGYLQIVSIGLLAITIGYIPIDRINRYVRHYRLILMAYMAYLFAITL